MNRLQDKIKKNEAKMVELYNQNIDLRYELMLTDAKSFSEKIENLGTKKQPRNVLVKKMHYVQIINDGDTGEPYKIERSKPVEIDGEKYFGWRKLVYMTIESICYHHVI